MLDPCALAIIAIKGEGLFANAAVAAIIPALRIRRAEARRMRSGW